MATFLNLNLDNKGNFNFIWQHILFILLWTVGILLFIFRFDIFILEKFSITSEWVKYSIPTIYFGCILLCFVFMKWYYCLALIVYPFLFFFWFLPKIILRRGKVYLFGHYLNYIYSKFANFKMTLINMLLILISLILLFANGDKWTRIFGILVALYFYFSFFGQSIKKAFNKSKLFGGVIEKKIEEFQKNENPKEAFIIKGFVIQESDKSLELADKRQHQLRRSLMANQIINLITERLNSFRGINAFLRLWFFQFLIFAFYSLMFFWFLNYQLYKITSENFEYIRNGLPIKFNFLYYTLKTFVFGDIENLKPTSMITQTIAVMSFAIVGIYLFIIVVHVLLEMKHERLNEDVKSTTDMFKNENENLNRFLSNEFGTEITGAMSEVKNIEESLKNIKKFIDQIF